LASLGRHMRAAGILLIGCVLLASGCRWLATPTFHTPAPRPADLPLAERTVPAPDVTGVGEPSAPVPVPGYYALSADECRDLACRNSPAANLIESGVIAEPGCLAHYAGRDAVDYLRFTAATHLSGEARNRSAAAALALYYKLLELELKADVLTNSVTEIDSLVKRADEFVEKGFKVPDDLHRLRKRRVDLTGDAAKLRSGIARLNAELKSLLAIDPGTPGHILPSDSVTVVPDPLDPDAAVQAGLANRSDLNLIRTVQNQTDVRTLAAAKRVLFGVSPLLAAVARPAAELSPLNPFVSGLAKAEGTALRRQLGGLLRDRERDAAKDIRTAVDEWTTARDLVAVARKKFELDTQRLAELEKERAAGLDVEAEQGRAKLELLTSEAELISAVVVWKLADVKAREAMGLLCGG
jgi:hypothetical protein